MNVYICLLYEVKLFGLAQAELFEAKKRMDAATIDVLCASGINTISKYAFSSSYVPGAPDEQPFTDAMGAALGGPPSLGVMAMLRRLLHESFAMTSAELKASVERVEDAPIRKLARLQRQKARLAGLRIEGRLEPSDRLVDAAVAMCEENRVSYLELSKCTSKDQEVLNSSLKEDRHMTIDHHGVVRLKDKEMKDDVNISTDMFLRLALMRRGLALEQANILDYLIHDRWVERIFDVRSAEQPEGYAQVSQQQVISADKKLFIKLAEFTRSGIQLQPSGRPADTAFVRAMEHPDVTHLLQPLPRISATSPPKRPLELAHTDRHVSPKTKGRSKGKSQQGSRTIRMPAGLEDGVPCTKAGNPVCFNHNPNGCHLQVTKGRCPRGLHACCYRGCHKMDHTYKDCPARRAATS